ncbi:MAG: hypothetical protein WBA12_15015 [Catalinimonas sp.]
MAFWVLGLSGAAVLAERRQAERRPTPPSVMIDRTVEHYFLHEEDVQRLLATRLPGPQDLTPARTVDLRELEHALQANAFVRRAEASRALDGSLHVDVQQVRPLARLVRRGAADEYVDEMGATVPLSVRYTARVPLVETAGWNWGEDSVETAAMFRLIQYIDGDPLWRAQIAHVRRDERGGLTFYPQVGKQRVEFGPPEQIESKFRRLRVFYDDILPAKGWNTYRRVNVAFENQIICE